MAAQILKYQKSSFPKSVSTTFVAHYSCSITLTPLIPRPLHAGALGERILAETQATSSKHYSGANWPFPWLVWMTPTQRIPQECNPVTILPGRPAGFVAFYITSAVRSWSNGVPNYGVVIRAGSGKRRLLCQQLV